MGDAMTRSAGLQPYAAHEFTVTDLVPLAPPRPKPRPRCGTCNGLGFTGRLLARSEDDHEPDDERVRCRDCTPVVAR